MEVLAMACKTGKKTVKAKGGVKKRKKIISTEFTLYAPDAKKVYLAGDFNNWDPEKYPMRKFKSGICKKKVKLKPGCYEYLFVVDGVWQTDPENSITKVNPYGTENSAIVIGEEVVQEC
jgi:5'-AMP-activated protein kinase regulatory beta subunit